MKRTLEEWDLSGNLAGSDCDFYAVFGICVIFCSILHANIGYWNGVEDRLIEICL